ncbi:MAG: transporter substrate-binding protein [Parvibaculaceae bacterium]
MRPRYISISRGAWEIGLIFSQTGRLANVGTSQLEGAILAVDEINAAGGVNGLPLSPVIRDDRSDPQRFVYLCDLMLREGVINIVFGGSSPEARRAAAPMFERRNGLLFYSGLGDGFDFSPNVFCFGLLPNQACGRVLREACRAEAKEVFVLHRDDLLSRGLGECLAREIERMGGSIVGEATVSDQPAEIAAALDRIEVSHAAVVFLAMGGSDAGVILQALRASGQTPKVVAFATSEKDLAPLAAAADGLFTVSTYCSGVASPVAEAFNTRFTRRYGRKASPDGFCEASYCAVCLFALALEHAGSAESDVIAEAVLGMSLCGPQGQVTMDAESNAAALWPRILRWGPDSRFEIVAESDRATMPDPFLIAHSDRGVL